ncbi:hypothetical protein [Streptomyces sp. 3213.3]|uniref:hypothetical protein n=1 Tax=Streptomyces sp. 3213.3 TaxID=1855348 RepID=UPI001042349E|nr:hypothetical protein [Streptomyces sp. 3213.3]
MSEPLGRTPSVEAALVSPKREAEVQLHDLLDPTTTSVIVSVLGTVRAVVGLATALAAHRDAKEGSKRQRVHRKDQE